MKSQKVRGIRYAHNWNHLNESSFYNTRYILDTLHRMMRNQKQDCHTHTALNYDSKFKNQIKREDF